MKLAFQKYRASVAINGLGTVKGEVDAEKSNNYARPMLRFRPDGHRARWVAAESVVKESS